MAVSILQQAGIKAYNGGSWTNFAGKANAALPRGIANNIYMRTLHAKISDMSEQKAKAFLCVKCFGNKCPRCRQGYIFQSRNPYEFKGEPLYKNGKELSCLWPATEIEVGFITEQVM